MKSTKHGTHNIFPFFKKLSKNIHQFFAKYQAASPPQSLRAESKNCNVMPPAASQLNLAYNLTPFQVDLTLIVVASTHQKPKFVRNELFYCLNSKYLQKAKQKK